MSGSASEADPMARLADRMARSFSRTWDAPASLQVKAGELAACLELRNLPGVRVCADALPWALAAGLVRPQLVVSSGLVALLDDEEPLLRARKVRVPLGGCSRLGAFFSDKLL